MNGSSLHRIGSSISSCSSREANKRAALNILCVHMGDGTIECRPFFFSIHVKRAHQEEISGGLFGLFVLKNVSKNVHIFLGWKTKGTTFWSMGKGTQDVYIRRLVQR